VEARTVKITVAIATWNRSALLRQALGALGQVRVPADAAVEVLVCDNNSTDQTRAVVEGFIAPWAGRPAAPLTLRYLFEPRPGKSHALNRILHEASGQWVLHADDDVLVGPDWLEAYLDAIGRFPRAGVLAGPVLPWLTRPAVPWQEQMLRQYPGPFALVYAGSDAPLDAKNIAAAGANLALRRQAVPPAGYDPELGPHGRRQGSAEDIEMIRAILDRGYEGWLLAAPAVRHYVHPHRLSRRYMWRWAQANGRHWITQRGKPAPGKLGVPWWAWRRMLRRGGRMVLSWRPWYAPAHMQAVVEAAQWWGYLRG
jgi:glycosyltransferase involved in cell wall biosynthesis